MICSHIFLHVLTVQLADYVSESVKEYLSHLAPLMTPLNVSVINLELS